MRTSSLFVCAPLLAVSLACGRDATAPTALHAVDAPLAARAPSDPTATWYLSNDASFRLRGDGSYLEGASSAFAGMSRYANGECGVTTRIFALSGESGDATMNTGSAGRCFRRISFTFEIANADGTTTPDGSTVESSFLNVRELGVATSTSTASYIPVGGDGLRTFALDVSRCGGPGTGALVFASVLRDGTVVGGDEVLVHRDAADQWTVTTAPDAVDALTGQTVHHDKAYCKGNGTLYHAPFRITIRSSAPLS